MPFFILHKIEWFWSTEIFQLHLRKGNNARDHWKLNNEAEDLENCVQKYILERYISRLEVYANTLSYAYIKGKWSSRGDRLCMQERVEVQHIKWKNFFWSCNGNS